MKIADFLSDSSRARHKVITETLDNLGISYTHNPNLVRGIDYYNDLCFEIKFDGEKGMTKDTLLGGGRYDYLFNQLMANKVEIPALG